MTSHEFAQRLLGIPEFPMSINGSEEVRIDVIETEEDITSVWVAPQDEEKYQEEQKRAEECREKHPELKAAYLKPAQKVW